MKIFKFLQVAFAVAVLSVSCRVTEIIDPEFEIPGLGGHEFSETDLDLWLEETFLEPYNIEVLYRWDAVQIYSDVTHKLIPIKTELVRPMMQTLANIWFEPIVEVAGSGFLQRYTPKTIVLAGSPEYQSNGSIVLGTAEGGVKIYLNNGNAFSATNRSVLVDYMHIIEHEFAHILNQNINYDQSFQDICSGEYEPSTWDDYESDYDAYARGFLSTYAMSSPDEDYVETLSLLLVHGMDWLEGTVIPEAEASTVDPEAAQKIRAKIAHVENYLLNSFGIMLFDDPLTGKKGFVTRVQEAIDYTIEEALANEL